MIRMCLQMFGGRGGGSGMTTSSSGSSSGASSTARIAGGTKSGDFVQTRDGVWESEKRAYSAVAFSGPDRRPVGTLDPQFTIVEGTLNGNTVYRLYEQHLGRKEFLKRFRSPNEAAKWANK